MEKTRDSPEALDLQPMPSDRHPPPPRARGFTLTELLVTMAISALLLALATPSFQQLRREAALRTAASQTMAALHLARRLALARGQSVTVCATVDGQHCAFGGTRWVLFANAPGGSESRLEAGDQVLRQWQLPEPVEVGGTRGYAAFQPRPGAAATVTFEFRYRGSPGAGRSIVVSQTGRARLVKG
jgi:type IV fimbrial biogenesis protein FimT